MSFVSGDTASTLRVPCTNEDGSVIDLTGATVELLWDDVDDQLVTRTMTVVDAVNGIAEYQFGATELFAPKMKFEVKITDAGGKVLRSIDLIIERVREALS